MHNQTPNQRQGENKKLGEKLLPFIICLLLPWLNVINTSPFRESIDILNTLQGVLFASTFLLLFWFANAWLFERFAGRRRLPVILGANLLMGGGYIGLLYLGAQDGAELAVGQPTWLIAMKIGMATVVVIAIQATLKAIRENEQLKTKNFALQTENYRAQLEQLQKQVNPHFLFNSLSTLQTMIRSQHAQSEEFVHRLSDVYRQLLQTRESDAVSLGEELDFLDAYLYLLKMRHGSALEININLQDPAQARQLPSFALQLLVENCTKHNIVSESRPLRIDLHQKDPHSISVTNNFQPKRNVQSFGLGLENLRKRYRLHKIEAGVEVQQNEHQFEVTLKLF